MIKKYLEEHIDVYKKLDISSFENGLELIRKTFLNKGKIITCGNGGSALTASHYITDWNKAITLETGVPFQGISLADNIGTITALANDLSYCDIFSEQLKALINRKDLLIAISGSGNSINVINAVEYRRHILREDKQHFYEKYAHEIDTDRMEDLKKDAIRGCNRVSRCCC